MPRVSLFIDYQNVYHGARNAFHGDGVPHSAGQVSPPRLGELLVARPPLAGDANERRLHEVRVYRGMPRMEDRGYEAAQRQHDAWRRGGVKVVTRPLAGPPGGRREKGIDVELALDFFAGALDDDFDVGIIFSADADLVPTIEKVLDPTRALDVVVEVANWWRPPASTFQLAKDLGIRHHRLTVADYERVRDRRNYTIADE